VAVEFDAASIQASGLDGPYRLASCHLYDVNARRVRIDARSSSYETLPYSTANFEPQDLDGDGISDSLDNCVGFNNPNQMDWDDDGIGDFCDPDIDGDDALNSEDCSIYDSNKFPGNDELCDGTDNNCNGHVDEGNPGGGASCGTGQPGVCSAGTQTCQGGALICSPNTQPSSEVCDSLDNNCDGQTDEGDVCGPVAPNITSPAQGAVLECGDPKRDRPTITWDPGDYELFRPYVAWDPSFGQGTKIGAGGWGREPSWTPGGKKWRRACKKAAQANPATPTLFIWVEGRDADVPKSDPNKTAFSPVVTVTTD
jgi:hypothetical protein